MVRARVATSLGNNHDSIGVGADCEPARCVFAHRPRLEQNSQPCIGELRRVVRRTGTEMNRDQDRAALRDATGGAAHGPLPETHAGRCTFVVLALLLCLALFPLLQSRLVWAALAVVALALICASGRWRSKAALHLAAFTCLLLGTLALFGSMKFWPLAPAVASGSYLLLGKHGVVFAGLPPWFARGRLDVSIWLQIGASVLVSSTALVLWFVLLEPDYGDALNTIF